MHEIEKRLETLGLRLPAPSSPAANYVPYAMSGTLLFISGQVPVEDGKIAFQGIVGKSLSLEEGKAAAKLCALHLLAQAKAALEGDLSRLVRCVKVGGFVHAAADFTRHPEIVNGASDLIVAAMGEAGRHARFAVGAVSLPANAAVELDAIFEIRKP